MRRIRPAVLVALLLLARPAALAAAPASPGGVAAEPARPWWVFFRDKGLATPAEELAAVRAAEAALTPPARERRAAARDGEIADLLDVPLHAPYVDAVLGTGAEPRVRARWVNALSVDATAAQVRAIAALPFVDAIRPVAQAKRHPATLEPAVTGAPSGPWPRSLLSYGECSSQIYPIQVDQLHDAGLYGEGVIVCVTDTGFLLEHRCFDSLDVMASWDFVNDDPVVANEPSDDPNQHNHGTYVLSLIGGYDPGFLIGPAYGATYLLAKTESIDFEMPVEEDYWVAAAQWADSLGARVISTSLGYKDWYTYPDLDGNTAVITIAADLAVANGISVLSSAGNDGNSSWYYILTPADGDSVAAIGAVDSTGVIASFSAHGPTFDGRIKPDVCAMGAGNLVATPWDPSDYFRGSGTSFSCPLVGGVVALLREARPTWGPVEILEALRSTATRAAFPDNDYGWGIVQAADALGWTTDATGTAPVLPGAALAVSPNPSARTSVIRWSLASAPAGEAILAIHDVRGRRVRELRRGALAGKGAAAWDGTDESGRPVASGMYFARLETGAGSRTARVIRVR